MLDTENVERTPDGVFIEIDEGDPIAELHLTGKTRDGVELQVGGLVTPPGRYELRKVEDDA